MSRLNDSIHPDFLSGTTEKIYRYDHEYYKILFDHFEKNIRQSDSLIVIGYGFGDKGINEFIKQHYLSRSKQMIVIDIKRPDEKLINPDHYKLIKKSITEVTADEIEDHL